MKGRVCGFQSMGAVDGPGLRCVIFAQGCPLRCAYCHNPESWEAAGGEDLENCIEEKELRLLDRKVERHKNKPSDSCPRERTKRNKQSETVRERS